MVGARSCRRFLIHRRTFSIMMNALNLDAADFTQRDESQWPAAGLNLVRQHGWLERSLEPSDDWSALLNFLRQVGYLDLTLGRIVEGHLNGLQLVHTFGEPKQWREIQDRARGGELSAIWDSELPGQGVVISEAGDGEICLTGNKAFASASDQARMAVLTATWGDGTAHARQKQMVLLDPQVEGVSLGDSKLELLGVKATATRSLCLEKVALPSQCLIGEPGDYLREPWLTAGAVRFLALWVGAMERLLELVRENYQKTGSPARTASVQRAARLGAVVWQARALLDSLGQSLSRLMTVASLEDQSATALEAAPVRARRDWAQDSLCSQTLCARHAIETLAHEALRLTEQEIGLKGMVEGHPLARLVRDLTVYLRQPATDTSLDRSGRYVLQGSPGHFVGELWEADRQFTTTSRFLRNSALDETELESVPAEFVYQFGRTVVLAPHPDDESIGVGGTLALLRAHWLPVKVIFLTDGDASHPESATLSRSRLADIRQREARAACHCLGVDDVDFCQLPDGHAPMEGDAGFAEAVALLESKIKPFDPHTLLTTWRRDRHGDHRSAYQLARAVIDRISGSNQPRLIEFPVWVWEARSPAEAPQTDEVRAVSVELGEDIFKQKCRALEQHASQLGYGEFANMPGFSLQPRHLDRFGHGREILLLPIKSHSASVGADFFENKYRGAADPWSYETSSYEQAKYQHLLSLLPEERMESMLELGCSIGVLTAMLASRARRLMAVDASATAIERAKARLSSAPEIDVSWVAGQLPECFPGGAYDAVIMSEVGYYLEAGALRVLIERILNALQPGGVVILMHWTVYVEAYPLTGDDVHEAFADAAAERGLMHTATGRKDFYRWDVWARSR